MRFIYFVRHGDYKRAAGGGTLTALGRKQSRAVARRLRRLPDLHALYSSTLGRAVETADVIAEAFPDVPLRRSRLIVEAFPTPTRGTKRDWVARSQANVQAARERFVRPSRTHRYEVLVTHGNFIRYLLCSVLDLPRRLWLRMAIDNCSLTAIRVRKGGSVALLRYNDAGHLPPHEVFG